MVPEFQKTIETIEFVWGFTAAFDFVLGIVMFIFVLTRVCPKPFVGLAWWCGWFAWFDAFTMFVNSFAGTDNPFAYHQIGIFAEMMVAPVASFYLIRFLIKNWYIRDEEWDLILKYRDEITIAKIQEKNNNEILRKEDTV